MKHILVVLVVSLGGILTSTDQFDSHVASLIMLMRKDVQKDIGLTETQRKAMNAEASRYNEQMKQLLAKSDPKKGIPPAATGALKQLIDLVFAKLSPPQLKRLGQISLQAIGPGALGDAEVAKRVGLDPAQLKKIRTTYGSSIEEAQKLHAQAVDRALQPFKKLKPKDQAEADKLNVKANKKVAAAERRVGPRLTAIRKAADAKVIGTLTPAQQATWKALLGKTFKP